MKASCTGIIVCQDRAVIGKEMVKWYKKMRGRDTKDNGNRILL